jgi:hypothetical protein
VSEATVAALRSGRPVDVALDPRPDFYAEAEPAGRR